MLASSLLVVSAVVAQAPAAGVPLFNGIDLTGWVNVNTGPQTWTVGKDVDGTPVIVCSGHPTGVLRTEKMYENFVIEFDYSHRTPTTNAGFFVWSDAITAPGQPFTRSIEVQVMDGIEAKENVNGKDELIYTSHGDIFSIHGSHMKPDRPHPAGWERCLPLERRAKPAPEWNHYKITGDHGTLKLEVNGKEVSGGYDITPRKGYLCLESEGGEVWFKNLRITELPPASPALAPEMVATSDVGFRSIFNGTDLTGWKQDGDAAKHWTVKDWVLSYDGKGSTLWSEESFGDFEMIVDWRWTGDDQGKVRRPKFAADGSDLKDANGLVETVEIGERDSGIFLRGNDKSQVNIWAWPAGSGEVWGYRTDASMPPEVRAACTPKKAADKPIGAWNRFLIRMKGDVLNVWLNGEHVIVDATLPGVPSNGPIALQHHGSSIDFANVYVRELK
ncbi:MAG: DUF1080 domain-containing protein [Phycisphaerae bacterium]|nr:DUF1080 domain-containing protein [Phycisphaerae bacterium]